MSKFAEIVNLQKGEEKGVIYLTVYSFFIGAALSFYLSSATTLFLDVFSRDFIPISFIAAGVLVLIIGKLMNYLLKNLNFSKSIPLGLLILLVSILIFLVIFKINESLVIVFILYAWIRVFSYIHSVVFWSLAGRLFSLRQAKRLFSLISGGEVVASIIGFFSVPILVKFIETSDLLFISGVFLVLAFAFMIVIVRNFKGQLEVKKQKKQIDDSEEVKLFGNKYFKLIFWIAFVPIFAQFFVEFIFQAQAKVEFPNKEELTSFIGIFFGFSSIVEFSLKTFFSGRMLSKYGEKFGLIAFPAVLAFSFLLASILGIFWGPMGMFFSFVAMGRLFTRAVRTSFNDPATQILFQPIPPNKRAILQNKIESGPKAYASIVSGLFLLGFSLIPKMSLALFSVMLFVITLIWIRLANNVFKEYKLQIQDYLSKTTNTSQKSFLRFFIQIFEKLFSKDNTIFSANLVTQFFPYNVKKIIADEELDKKYKLSQTAEMADSKNSEERVIAAKNIANFNIYKVERLFFRLLNDEDFSVRNQAIISAGRTKDKALFDKIIDNFKIKNYRKTAINAILNIGEPIVPKLIKTFYSNEYSTGLQLEIVDTLSQIKCNQSVLFLRNLINYPVKVVREHSITALAKQDYEATKIESVLISSFLEEEIRQFVYLNVSIYDLSSLDKSDFLYVELQEVLQDKKQFIFDILSVLYNRKAIELIRNNLIDGDAEKQGFAIEIADNVFSELHKELLLPILEGVSNYELLRRYRHFFAQENLKVYDRIIDLINAELKTTGVFVKMQAIKKLVDYNNEKTIQVLTSVIVSPIDIISETAAFTLFLINEVEFLKSVEKFKFKKERLIKLEKTIKQESGMSELLIFEKLQLLKSLTNFSKLGNYDLYLVAKDSKKIVIKPDEVLELNKKDNTTVYIIISGILTQDNGMEYDSGSIISSLFVNYNNNKFVAIEPVMMFKVPLFVVNYLFTKNIEFTESVFNKIIDQEKALVNN